jgi:hypothetical protein
MKRATQFLGQHGWNGVEREDDVGGLDYGKRDKGVATKRPLWRLQKSRPSNTG